MHTNPCTVILYAVGVSAVSGLSGVGRTTSVDGVACALKTGTKVWWLRSMLGCVVCERASDMKIQKLNNHRRCEMCVFKCYTRYFPEKGEPTLKI